MLLHLRRNVDDLLQSWQIGRIDTVLEFGHDQDTSDCRLEEMLDTGQTGQAEAEAADQRLMRTESNTGEAAGDTSAHQTGEDMFGTEAGQLRT